LMQKARQEHPSLNEELGRGEYQTLLQWLRRNVHQQGSRYRPPELIQRITGAPTGIQPHLEHLRSKYGGAA